MGFYSRYSAAFLIIALLTPKAFSAVRVPVVQNDEYIRLVLSRQTASTGAISTPAGDLALFGPDKNYAFNSDGSFRPSIRETKPVGVTSYPYGTGAMYPGDPGPDIIGKSTNLKVKPKVVVPKLNILNGLKDGLKSQPSQLLLGAAVSAAVGAVGWVMSPENTQLQKVERSPIALDLNVIHWDAYGYKSSSASGAVSAFLAATGGGQVCGTNGTQTIDSGSYFIIRLGGNCQETGFTVDVWRYGQTCPHGTTYDTTARACAGTRLTNLDLSDYSQLDPWVSQQSAEWLSGLIKEVCNSSLNPAACYSQMADRSKGMITGPALLPGPVTTKTTQVQNPDGTTSTRTESTKTDYKLTYGKDYFDVDTEKKTTVIQDGQLVSETTEKDDTPVQDNPDTTPGEEQQPEPDYTFSDSPFPEIKPFYEQKYPEGLAGVWNQAKSNIDSSSFMQFLSSFVPSFSGSCPTFGLSFAIGNMANFGSVDFQSLCYVFEFVKIILLVTAVFAARQLTFGG